MTQESIEQNTQNNSESPTDLQELGNRLFADSTNELEAPEEFSPGITPSSNGNNIRGNSRTRPGNPRPRPRPGKP
ncbi:hypothetical protein ACE1CI_02480 [Aerosakkonemataceae cyanobacterium BLCC-F50]|uniref:Uncharacterized protein n=1 Tax=Floridaenema flaviceps BLCC-F50 TaxID=3153642 RepID=A0ABV4XJA4_9CYAN